jgi:hypothetical protein
VTIYEVGEVGGPGPGIGSCPAGLAGAVASTQPNPPVHYGPTILRSAAIVANQQYLKDVIVFPERDFVSITGFPENTALQVVVRSETPYPRSQR